MEILIENAIIDLVTAATITDQDENIPKNITHYLGPWEEWDDYPAIVVTCSRSYRSGQQIQGINRTYEISVYILTVSDDYDTVVEQRNDLKEKIDYALLSNQRLGNLADSNDRERVYNMEVRDTTFTLAGFEGNFQALARIDAQVETEQLGPFT